MVAFTVLVLVIIIILIALIFDFTNGFHDSANSIATIVSTKVLSPRNAVVLAAFFNFIAAFSLGVAVANTVSKIIELGYVEKNIGLAIIPYIILASLTGAIAWNIITWYLGLPTSSSHALIGGLMGAGIAAAGFSAIHFQTIAWVVLFMFLSPVIGLICGFLFMVAVLWACRNSSQAKVDRHFRKLQLVSASAYSFSHGTNDAQKTIGVIALLLLSINLTTMNIHGNINVPLWVIIAAYSAIAIGTLVGGWRIVKTMGTRITTLRPVHGFAAETSGATTIIGASMAGIPVSTTHVICASIMGVGATKRASAVRWGVARRIIWAWFLTIPISALIGYLSFSIIHFFI